MKMIRVVHYLNQFFGGMGGEEKASMPPTIIEGPIGPGVLVNTFLKGEGQIIASVICGDNYVSENMAQVAQNITGLIENYEPHLLIAGPAFGSGRYGIACGEVCKWVEEKLRIPCVTGMHMENPAVELYKKDVFIVLTTRNAVGMREAINKMVRLGIKLVKKEPLGEPCKEGYVLRGIKINVISDKLAAERAIIMLLRKMQDTKYKSEVLLSKARVSASAPPIHDLSEAVIALITEGGLVPKGNPDRIESARATRYAKYDIDGLRSLEPNCFECIHRGFDTRWVNEDPNRLIPLDVLREMEGKLFKRIFPFYFVTTGVATSVENAQVIGEKMAFELKSGGVSGVILTST